MLHEMLRLLQNCGDDAVGVSLLAFRCQQGQIGKEDRCQDDGKQIDEKDARKGEDAELPDLLDVIRSQGSEADRCRRRGDEARRNHVCQGLLQDSTSVKTSLGLFVVTGYDVDHITQTDHRDQHRQHGGCHGEGTAEAKEQAQRPEDAQEDDRLRDKESPDTAKQDEEKYGDQDRRDPEVCLQVLQDALNGVFGDHRKAGQDAPGAAGPFKYRTNVPDDR